MCQVQIRWWRLGATCKKHLQFIEQRLLGFVFVLRGKTFRAESNQSFGPTAIEELMSSADATVSLKKRLCLVDPLFVQGQKTLSTTTLLCSFAVGSVYEEVFGRGEQEPAKPAFLPVDLGIDLVLDQMGKKTLREILGVMH